MFPGAILGTSTGIGTETSWVLELCGVHVVMGVRNTSVGREVKEAIPKQIPTAKVDPMDVNMGSIASVNNFVSVWISLALISLLFFVCGCKF